MTWADIVGGIVSGLVSGVLTAAIWSGMLWAYNWYRDYAIEKALKQQFFPKSFSFHASGSQGFPIKNESRHVVIVRDVSLIGLMPEGHEGLTIQFRFDPKESHAACKQLPGGWVEMLPDTKGMWIAPQIKLAQPTGEITITGSKVVIEYKTLLGATKLITICPPRDSGMQAMIAKHYNDYYNQRGPFTAGGFLGSGIARGNAL